MTINIDKPDRWKIDIAQSVDMYNEWFLRFAPKAFRETRIKTTKEVEETLKATSNLTVLSASLLTSHPEILPTLRMCACPPLAVDRLIGLSGVPKNLVLSLEGNKRIPPQMSRNTLTTHLKRLMETLSRLADPDIFPWLSDNRKPLDDEVARAATIVADRLCGAYANPIVRNAQEARQLASIEKWLKARGYIRGKVTTGGDYRSLRAGSYALRMNVNVSLRSGSKRVNIPVDVLIMPKLSQRVISQMSTRGGKRKPQK